MTRQSVVHKLWWSLTAVVVCSVIAVLVFWPKPPKVQPVTISHYRFLLHSVSEDSEWGQYLQHSPYHQVCVAVEIQRANLYYDSSGNQPRLFGNMVIPLATLTTKDGTRLHLLDAQAIEEDPLHFQIVHHVYEMFHPESDDLKYYMIYVFENPEEYKTADFEADVYVPAYDVNGTRNAEPPPYVRPLRFDNLSLP